MTIFAVMCAGAQPASVQKVLRLFGDLNQAQRDRVLGSFMPNHPSVVVSLIQKNILDDGELAARYSEEIPVLLINGKVHNYWRIDENRFSNALTELAAQAATE